MVAVLRLEVFSSRVVVWYGEMALWVLPRHAPTPYEPPRYIPLTHATQWCPVCEVFTTLKSGYRTCLPFGRVQRWSG